MLARFIYPSWLLNFAIHAFLSQRHCLTAYTQTSKLRVGTNNQYVVSNGRNIVLHDLLTGEVKKLVTVDRDVDHSIGDMVWLGADHIAYYTEWLRQSPNGAGVHHRAFANS